MSLQGKRILLTGGSGFLGSHLCEKLLQLDNQLTLLCLPDDPLANLQAIQNQLQVVRCDLTDTGQLEKIVKGVAPQYVYHLAARIDRTRSARLLGEMVANNLLPIVSLIQALAGFELERFLVLGTSDIYGQTPAPCREDASPNPNSPYALTKSLALTFARYAWQNYNLPAVMLVPFMVYGPRQNPRMMISQALNAVAQGEDFPMTRGEQVREFNYVGDIVAGLITAATAEGVLGETINLCGGPKLTIYEASQRIFSMLGARGKLLRDSLPYRAQETMSHFGDPEKCRRLLNYQPQTSFEDGIKKTYSYFQDLEK